MLKCLVWREKRNFRNLKMERKQMRYRDGGEVNMKEKKGQSFEKDNFIY